MRCRSSMRFCGWSALFHALAVRLASRSTSARARLRRQLSCHQAGYIQWDVGAATQRLKLAHAYVHLGGAFSADSGMGPEIARRAAAASTAAAELRRGTLGRADVDLHVKMVATMALVDSRLYFNAGTWARPQSLALMEGVQRRLLCKM